MSELLRPAVIASDLSSNLVVRVVGLLIGVFVLVWSTWISQWPVAISLAVLLFALLQYRFPHVWFVVLPALLPVLDLMPWSGELLINSFDLLVLTAIAVGWSTGRINFVFINQFKLFSLLIIGLLVSYLISLWNGYQYLQQEISPAFHFYHTPENSVRVSKGLFEALLLLPMVSYTKQLAQPLGRLVSWGMIAGLTLCIGVIVWERLFFPGLLDYSTNYRVTGLFSGMLLGGAFIDAYLVLAFPFFMICLIGFRSRWMLWLGVALFIGGLYSFLVTFTRSTYAALIVIILILGAAGLKAQIEKHKRTAIYLLLMGLASLVVVPVIGGKFAAERFSTAGADFSHRYSHWSNAYSMVSDSWLNIIFGKGKGTFPLAYFNETLDGASMGRFWIREENGQSFLRMSASGESGDLYLRQRIQAQDSGRYRASITLRSPTQAGDKLLVEFCQRNILSLAGSCSWQGFRVPANKQNQWVTINLPFSLGYRDRFMRVLRPFEVSLLNRGLKTTLDIARVEIFAPDGKQLVTNPDFEEGFQRWFFSSGNHLAWHVKNLWVSAFFEGGVIELLLVSGLIAWLLYRLVNSNWRREPYTPVLLASFSGFLAVAAFGSVFDEPRISFLFYLLAWIVVVSPETESVTELNTLPWNRMIMGTASLAAIAIAVGVVQIMLSHKLNPRELLQVVESRLGLEMNWLEHWVRPDPRYRDHQFDGQISQQHPRIVLTGLRDWDGRSVPSVVQSRLPQYRAEDKVLAQHCSTVSLLDLAVCWIKNPDEQKKSAIVHRMRNMKLKTPTVAAGPSVAWQLALAYDLVYNQLSKDDRNLVEAKITQALKDSLLLLDEDSASLWHSRVSHAAVAWLCAVVLSVDGESDNQQLKQLQTQAQAHFLSAIEALAFTEVWPEGFNYWIQNRAFLLTLASAAYINGVEDGQNGDAIRDLLRTVGYWHIYATRPDHRIEDFADSGSRVDLKDETRRVIDLIAQLTEDPVIAGYSKYIGRLHGRESYYRRYRWGFLLFNDPQVAAVGDGSLASLAPFLGNARLFGKNTTNHGYFRSGWGEDATFVSYRAGHTFTHHGHYDAGHFTLHKGAPLAVNGSNYGNLYSENRLHYSIRTIAKNSLLILKPNERVKPNRFFEENVAAGGQRITMPTGSSVVSVADWWNNYKKGEHYEGAELIASDLKEDWYSYVASDLTSAYNSFQYDENGESGKVRRVVRSLLYLHQQDQLIVYDKVDTLDEHYLPKWLLHTISQPEVAGPQLLLGKDEDGITESTGTVAIVRNQNSFLKVERLLPEQGVMRIVGGKNYNYYVEADGDEHALDGVNFSKGAVDSAWFDNPDWRLEIQPGDPDTRNRFLVVLSPSIGAPVSQSALPLYSTSSEVVGLVTDRSVVVFVSDNREDSMTLSVPEGERMLYLVGLRGRGHVQFSQQGSVIATADYDRPVTHVIAKITHGADLHINW